MSGRYCAAKSCSNSSTCQGISFFRFPKDENRCKEWLRKAERSDLYGKTAAQLYSGYRLCSAHFVDADYATTDKKRLLSNAVPSIFRPLSQSAKTLEHGQEGTSGSGAKVQEFHDSIDNIADDVHQPEPLSQSESLEYAKEGMSDSGAKVQEFHALQQPSTSGEMISAGYSIEPSTSQFQPSKPTPRTKRKLQRMQSSLSRLRVQYVRCKKKISFQKRQKLSTFARTSLNTCLSYARENLNINTYKLFKAQLLIQRKSKYGRKWTDEMKKFALNLYFHSPRTYKLCSKFLALPKVRSLQVWLGKTDMTTGINESVLAMLKNTIPAFSDMEKICVLSMDEMSLKMGLFYDQKKDQIIGFEHLRDGVSPKIANQALVFMIRWIAKNWKQPIGYYFSKESTPPTTLRLLVLDIIEHLKDIGLTVIALVCDQGPNNQSMARSFEISEKQPYFLVGDEKVFFFYDPPHLLKSFRNNFKKYGLKVGEDNISWTHLENLFKSTHPLRLKLVPKITDKHISVPPFKNMKVSLAAQVFSNSLAVAIETFVALGFLPSEAIHTAKFLERMDKLFDTFNSSRKSIKEKQKLRYALSDTSDHISFLKETLQWLHSVKFNSIRQPPSLKGWKVNICSLLNMWEHLKESCDIEYLCTRKFCQDCIENLFSIIRQKHGCNVNPTPIAFENAMKHIFVSTLFKLSENSNCEEDSDIILQQLHQLPSVSSSSVPPVQDTRDEESEGINPETSTVEQNARFYVAGYICRKFLQKHQCDHCRNALVEKEPHFTDHSQMFTYLKAINVPEKDTGDLTICTPSFFQIFNAWEDKFNENLPNIFHIPCIKQNLKGLLNNIDVSQLTLCEDSLKHQLLETYLRIRIFWAVNFKNREIHSKDKIYQTKKLRTLSHV